MGKSDENSAENFRRLHIDGPVAAIGAAVRPPTQKVNVIGYCIGGTMTAVARLYVGKGDDRVASATFFTTLVDFEEPGELGVSIDEEQISGLEEKWVKGVSRNRDGHYVLYAAGQCLVGRS